MTAHGQRQAHVTGCQPGRVRKRRARCRSRGSERVVVEVRGERVHDGTADGGSEHQERQVGRADPT